MSAIPGLSVSLGGTSLGDEDHAFGGVTELLEDVRRDEHGGRHDREAVEA